MDAPCDNHTRSVDPPYPAVGLVAGCLSIDLVLQSTLECFFSRSCLDMLLVLRGYDLKNSLVPLNDQTRNISVLDSTRLTRYLPTTAIGTFCQKSVCVIMDQYK